MKKISVGIFILSICLIMVAGQAQAQLVNYNRRNTESAPPAVNASRAAEPAEIVEPDESQYNSRGTNSYYNREDAVEDVQKEEVQSEELSSSKGVNRDLLLSSPSVSSRVEKIYDLDHDGVLQENEIVEFLGDVVSAVERRGGFSVSSDILENFDKDADGEISLVETEEIKQYLN